ncbi:MAG: AmmeMemoRadiSam system radical SAM enzyme [Bacillota bacterium]
MEGSREACCYEKLENDVVLCRLCPHHCRIADGEVGRCKARKNEKGKLFTLNYGKVTSYYVDPIEKKPLYHFFPGKRIFSVGSFGCNLQCSFCQNWEISQKSVKGISTTAQNLVDIGKNEKDNIGIAYTYNEPSIWYEFVYDTAKLAREAGLKNVLVTNGYIEKEPLRQLLPYIDGMNIDLKGFNKNFYHEICGGQLEIVKDTIIESIKACHVEITTLVIDHSVEEIEEIAKWIGTQDKDIPLHLSRYFPSYKMEHPPTAIEKLHEARVKAQKHLQYVYLGNLLDIDKNTYCPTCHAVLVERNVSTVIRNFDKGVCTNCGEKIPIIGE